MKKVFPSNFKIMESVLFFSTMLATCIPSWRSVALLSSKVGIGYRSTYPDFLRQASYRSAATCIPYMTMSISLKKIKLNCRLLHEREREREGERERGNIYNEIFSNLSIINQATFVLTKGTYGLKLRLP